MDSMPVCILCTKWCHTQNLCIYACFGSPFHSKLGPHFDKLGSPLHVMKTRSLYRPHGESGSLFLRLLKGSHPKFQVRYWFAVISAFSSSHSQKQWSPTFYLKIKSRTQVKSRVPLIGTFLPFLGNKKYPVICILKWKKEHPAH